MYGSGYNRSSIVTTTNTTVERVVSIDGEGDQNIKNHINIIKEDIKSGNDLLTIPPIVTIEDTQKSEKLELKMPLHQTPEIHFDQCSGSPKISHRWIRHKL